MGGRGGCDQPALNAALKNDREPPHLPPGIVDGEHVRLFDLPPPRLLVEHQVLLDAGQALQVPHQIVVLPTTG